MPRKKVDILSELATRGIHLLLRQILSHLDMPALRACLATSKSWRRYVTENVTDLASMERVHNLMGGDGSQIVPFVRGVSEGDRRGSVRFLRAWDGRDFYYLGNDDITLYKFEDMVLRKVERLWSKEVGLKYVSAAFVFYVCSSSDERF